MPLLPDRLLTGEMFGRGEGFTSSNRRFTCQLGTDGVLRVLRNRAQRPRQTVWTQPSAPFAAILTVMRESGHLAVEGGTGQEVTFPPTPAPDPQRARFSTAVMRDDGILAIENQDGGVEWSSPHPRTNEGTLGAGDFLDPGEMLAADGSIWSQDGTFQLTYQSDGNLVLYRLNPGADRSVLWASGTHGRAADRCYMNPDGQLQLFDRDDTLYWSSHPGGSGRRAHHSRLKLYNRGLLRIESPRRFVMWRAPVAQSATPRADAIAIVASPSPIMEVQAQVEVRVVLHTLSDSNGANPVRVAPAEAQAWIDTANAVLAPARLRLRFDRASDIRPMRNTRLNRLIPGTRTRNDVYGFADAELASRAEPEVLHVYARTGRPVDGTTGNCGVGCGFSWWTMSQAFVPDFDANLVTLFAHELGHFLGLPHTMAHVIDTLNDARLLFAFVTPNPSAFDGDRDFVSDTPPDLYIATESASERTGITLGGTRYDYLRSNVMSYYAPLPMQAKTISAAQAVRVREILFRRSKRGLVLHPV